MRPPRAWCRLAAPLLVAIFLLGGCVWHGGAAQHYIGPVLFRYEPPTDDRPSINEVVTAGLVAEGGGQWGLSVGVVDRTTVSPRYVNDEKALADGPRWWTALSPFAPPVPGRWNVSLIYLRVTGLPAPGLVARRLYGVQLVSGPEARALSVGMTSVTRVWIPDDVFAVVRYDARSPLRARFSVWRADSDHALAATEILNEVNR